MNTNIGKYLFITLLLVAVKTDIALADQIYKWTDSEGLTHYSETPPVALTGSVDTLAIDLSGYQGNAGKDDYYSVVNQARRLEESRLKNEKLRLERDAQRVAEIEARKKNESAYIVIEQPSYPVYSSAPGFRRHAFSKHHRNQSNKRNHVRPPSKPTGLSTSPALQVRAFSGKALNTSPALNISFEDSVNLHR